MKKIIIKDKCEPLIDLQKKIIEWVNEYLDLEISSLDELHRYIDVKEINDLRLNLFTKLNTNYDWKKAIMEIAGNEIRNTIGPDICVQKKINFSIQLPQDHNSILGMHSDSWSAETPYQINVWIPLTDSYSSNSMFVLDKDRTLEVTKSIIQNSFYKIPSGICQDADFLKMKFGEILIFNPCLLHGNILNKTDKTRIALHLRFKNIYAPELKAYPDRTTGIFYEPLEVSENTKFAMEYIKAANGLVKISN